MTNNMTYEHSRRTVAHELAHLHGVDNIDDPAARSKTIAYTGWEAPMLLDPTNCDIVNARDQAHQKRAEFKDDPYRSSSRLNSYPGALPCRWGNQPVNGWCYSPWSPVERKWDVTWRILNNNPSVGQVTTSGTVGTSGAITIGARDPDGAVMRVDWYANGAFVYTALDDPFELPYTNVAPGTYTVQAQMWDYREATSWTAPVTITVQGSGTGGGGNPGTTMHPWQRLYAGQRLYSPNGVYYLEHQSSDGHLVEYDSTGTPVWATGFWTSSGGGFTEMDGSSGNLVSYDPSAWPYWAANPPASAGSYLQIHNDGTIEIYSPGGSPLCTVTNIPWGWNSSCP